MKTASLLRLLLLSAIWGASFLFMRVGAPVLGPALLIFARVFLAAVFLLAIGIYLKKSLDLRRHWKHFLVLGFFNSALPFFLYAIAAQTVSASLLSVLNATAPIWAMAIGAVWQRNKVSGKEAFGMLLGVAGVALFGGAEALALPNGGGLAVAAGLGAALCYGTATTYSKTARMAQGVDPFANAHGCMWAATLMLAPFLLQAHPLHGTPAPHVLLSVFTLGVVCSGVAYLLYFRLIADIGAAPALTVTFLIPVFGVFWGVVFLGEQISWHTIVGGLTVLSGTALVTGFSPRQILPKRSPA